MPYLTYRHCRTTFATLYEGDPRDARPLFLGAIVRNSPGVYTSSPSWPGKRLPWKGWGTLLRKVRNAGEGARVISSICVQTSIDKKGLKLDVPYQRISLAGGFTFSTLRHASLP